MTELSQCINMLFHLHDNKHTLTNSQVDFLISKLTQDAYNMVLYQTTPRIHPVVRAPIVHPVVRAPIVHPVVRAPNIKKKIKLINKKKFDEVCIECAICLKTTKYNEAAFIDCNHYFCKNCLNSWINAEKSNKKCPTCRNNIKIITSFKLANLIIE